MQTWLHQFFSQRSKAEWTAQRHDCKHVPRHDCGQYINRNILDISCPIVISFLPLEWPPICIRFCMNQNNKHYVTVTSLGEWLLIYRRRQWLNKTNWITNNVTEATNKSTWLWKPTIEQKRPLQLHFLLRHRLHKDSSWTVSVLQLLLLLSYKLHTSQIVKLLVTFANDVDFLGSWVHRQNGNKRTLWVS